MSVNVVLDILPQQETSNQHSHISIYATPCPSLEAQPSLALDLLAPEGGTKAWLVVFGSLCVITGSFGLQTGIGVFQSHWQMHQLSMYSSSEVGWICAVNIFLTLILGVQIGPLFDRYGPRWLLLSGSMAYVGMLALMAQCSQYWHFMVVFGIIAGVATAALVTTSVAVIAHWFDMKRGQANGVVFLGSSVGGILIPLIMGPLLDRLGWAWAMRILALIIGILMVVGNAFVKGRLPKGKRSGAVDLGCFKDTRFTWVTVGVAGGEFVLFGTLGLLPTFALERGFSTQTSFYVIAALNAGSSIGRYIAGQFSDKFGRINTVTLSTLFAILSIFAIWLPVSTTRSLPLLYVFATLFGFSSGSIISLAPVCFGQLCKSDEYGTFYGTGYSVISFAYGIPPSVSPFLFIPTLICIPIGGALIPAIGSAGFVLFFGGVLCFSLLSFLMARWACLDYRWKWSARI